MKYIPYVLLLLLPSCGYFHAHSDEIIADEKAILQETEDAAADKSSWWQIF